MSDAMKVRAIRGATTIAEDSPDQVLSETATLLEEMMQRNELRKEDLVSIIFTATPDIRSEYPAAAARKVKISHIPLLCARELDIEGEEVIPLVIRVLMHVHTDKDYDTLRHVYLGEARALRTDLRQ